MKHILISFRLFLVLTIITGVIYPAAVTIVAKLFFPYQANGSLITREDKVIGSELLAQKFVDNKYFWPRPSAGDYSTVASAASNLGPTNAKLKELISVRENEFREKNQLLKEQIVPAEMVLTSASGLDPDISIAAARLQVKRISTARNFDQRKTAAVLELIDKYTINRQYAIFGEHRVNVLMLNVALDSL
ncbi:MAG: potassium-transporting ATPase subunit KdpC [Proteobacteria bacterium]|nr:potassium-transporting ATPase subunit KdpC [Pseudomonadota bacterium]